MGLIAIVITTEQKSINNLRIHSKIYSLEKTTSIHFLIDTVLTNIKHLIIGVFRPWSNFQHTLSTPYSQINFDHTILSDTTPVCTST